MPLDMLDRIRSFPLFQSAPEAFLAAIGSHLRPQSHSSHDYILTEGDDAKAMYWLVRGAVAVTSRDGESTYAELKPGAFFGEIGCLMGIPRTATIIARTKCLLVVLKKEDLAKELPKFPDVERTIREEALERLAILESKKKEKSSSTWVVPSGMLGRGEKRAFDGEDADDDMVDDNGVRSPTTNNKKRKSPSPSLIEAAASSALGSSMVTVRQLLKELPLFSGLPSDILHFLGSNAQQCTYPPFTDIIKQNSQGREVFFIVRGEVEIIDEKLGQSPPEVTNGAGRTIKRGLQVKARLKQGNYFGEVASLSLAPRRTATVRSVAAVECLLITGEIIDQFWARCPAKIREQINRVAKERLHSTGENDVIMSDVGDSTPPIDELAIGDRKSKGQTNGRVPLLKVEYSKSDSSPKFARMEDRTMLEPLDPDPYLSIDLEARPRSRRSSLAPVSPEAPPERFESKPPSGSTTPKKFKQATKVPNLTLTTRNSKSIPRTKIRASKDSLPEKILISIFSHFELHELMRLRRVSPSWTKILREAPELFHDLNLSRYNRKITDETLLNHICPFIGHRPRCVDLSNCFHVTDRGFVALATMCGGKVTSWKMKSVWDVSAVAIHEMIKQAKDLEEVDLSNCRKVNDALLMHIIGNVPQQPAFPGGQQSAINRHFPGRTPLPSNPSATQAPTMIGAQKLRKLTLSYCKHVTDRSMAHIGHYARGRLEEIDLTRCTTISDHGFEAWGQHQFSRLTKICLADCTYLTDNAIVYLTNAAQGMRYLDLVSHFSSSAKQSTNLPLLPPSHSAAPSLIPPPKFSPSAVPTSCT